MFVKEYLIGDTQVIEELHGKLFYRKITIVPDLTHKLDQFEVPGRCMLYEDYAYCFSDDTSESKSFYEITKIEVDKNYRRQGIGTVLQRRFFDEVNPNIILGYYGVTSEEIYNSFKNSNSDIDIITYLHDNNESFGKTFGFVTVDDIIPRSESIAFVWPREEAIRMRKIHKMKYELFLKKTNKN